MVSRHLAIVGAQIKSANGEYAPAFIDASFRGNGLRLQLRRQYRSGLADRQGLLGRGWISPFERRLIAVEDGVIYEDADGARHRFHLNDGQYQTPDGLYALLVAVGDRLALRLAGGRTLWFDSPQRGGRLAAAEDRNGNTIRLEHEADAIEIVDTLGRRIIARLDGGRIERIVDNTGRAWTYSYDEHACLTAVRLPTAAHMRYAYDDARRLVVLTDANGHDAVRNRYDDAGRVIEQRWGREHFVLRYDKEAAPRTHVQLATGAALDYVHDTGGRAIERTLRTDTGESFVTQSRFNRHGERIGRTSPSGRRSEWRYDEDAADPRNRGNLLETRRVADGHPPIRVTYEYDPHLQQLRALTDARGNTENYEHDAHGNVTAVRRPVTIAGKTETLCLRFEYDDAGRQTRRIDASGGITRYTYGPDGLLARVEIVDDAGRALRTRSYRYDAAGNVVEILDGKGNITRLAYDAAGRVIRLAARGPAAPRVEIRRDANGNAVEEIVYDREHEVFRRSYAYDERNRLLRVTASGGGEERARELVRDAAGRVVRRIAPGGRITEIAYDARGLPSERRRDAGTPDASVVRRRYDADGNLVAVHDDAGRTVEHRYDAWRRYVGSTDRAGTRRDLELDAAGNVTLRRVVGRAQPSQDKQTVLAETRYHYDEVGRCTRIERLDPSGKHVLAATTFVYSGARLARMEAENGNTIHFDHDAAGQLIEAKDATGESMRLGYDANGNLVRVVHGGAGTSSKRVVDLAYDALDRLIAQSLDSAPPTLRSYDALGRLVRRGDVHYRRDGLGRIVEVKTRADTARLQWDPADRVVGRIDVHGRRWLYQYDARGLLNAVVHPGGNVTRLAYDRVRNPKQIVAFDGHTVSLQFDAENRLVARTVAQGETRVMERFERDGLGRVVEATSGAVHLRRRYDALSRIAAEDISGREVAYRFDAAAGHEVVQPDGTRLRRDFDRLGRVSALRADTGAVLVRTTYDLGRRAAHEEIGAIAATYKIGGVSYRAGGHTLVTSERVPDAGDRMPRAGSAAHTDDDCLDRRVSYDPRGRLVRVDCRARTGAAKRIEYAYDAFDRLTRKTVHTTSGDVEVRYVWNGPRLAQIVDPRVATWDLLYGASDRRPVALRRRTHAGAALFVCLWDARGVVVGLADGNGRVAERYAIDDRERRRVIEIDGHAVETDTTDAPSGNPVLAEGSLWDGDAQLALLDGDRLRADRGGGSGEPPDEGLFPPLEPVPIPSIDEKLPLRERLRRINEIADEEANARERWRRDQEALRAWREWMNLMDQLDKALKDLRDWLWGRLSEECLKGNDWACAQLGDPELFPELASGDIGSGDDDDDGRIAGGTPTSGGSDDGDDDNDSGQGRGGDDPDPPESGDPPDETGGTVEAMPGTDIVVGPGTRHWGAGTRGAESISLATVIAKLWGGVIDPPFDDDAGGRRDGGMLANAIGQLEPFGGDFVDVIAGSQRLYPPRPRPGVVQTGGDPRAPGWTDPPRDADVLAESAVAGQTNETPGSDALVVVPGACTGSCAEPGCGRGCSRV